MFCRNYYKVGLICGRLLLNPLRKPWNRNSKVGKQAINYYNHFLNYINPGFYKNLYLDNWHHIIVYILLIPKSETCTGFFSSGPDYFILNSSKVKDSRLQI